MAIVNCEICTKAFYAKPSHLQRGWGKYCSKACNNEAQRTGKYFSCFTCKKLTYKLVRDQARSKSGKYFCTKSCQTLWRNTQAFVGERHGNWKGGKSSYRQRLLKTDRAQVCLKCKTEDKRVLAVHHKDKNRLNNKFSNLMWLCHNCHYLIHHFKDEAKNYVVPVA